MVDVASLQYNNCGFKYSEHQRQIGGITKIKINNGIAHKDGKSEFKYNPYNGDTVYMVDHLAVSNIKDICIMQHRYSNKKLIT